MKYFKKIEINTLSTKKKVRFKNKKEKKTHFRSGKKERKHAIGQEKKTTGSYFFFFYIFPSLL